MTRHVRSVLRSLLEAPCHVRFGYEILQEGRGLTVGSVYPILKRPEAEGWLVSAEIPSERARPPRRCYRFTELGLAEAQKVLSGDSPASSSEPPPP